MTLLKNTILTMLLYIAVVVVLFLLKRERLAKILIDCLIAAALVAIAVLLLWMLTENSLCALQTVKNWIN